MTRSLFMMALCLCLSAKYVSSIKCYECTSNTESNCSSISYAGTTSECSDTACIVIFERASVIRSCRLDKVNNLNGRFDMTAEFSGRITKYEGATTYWRTCETDLCNGGLGEYNQDYNHPIREAKRIREEFLHPSTIQPWEIRPMNNEVVYKSNIMLTLLVVMFWVTRI